MIKKRAIAGVPPRKMVGIWIRVSTEQAANGESPAVHEHRARAYADAHNWKLFTVYHLEGVSGKSVMEHSETRRMLDDVRNGRITGLIFSKMARLARNTRELLEFADIFQSCGADLISILEAIDTSTPGGRLFFTLLAAITQWEREEIVERIKASVPIRAKLGRPLNGNSTLGYHWVDKHLVPDPVKAPIRKLLYVRFSECRRLKTAAHLMNSAGYRTANGARFNCRTVRRLIQDTTPVGLRKTNYTTLTTGRKVQLKPEADWVIAQVEPIVPKELWQFCNSLLANRKTGQRPGRRPVHLFGGLIWCECGHKMYVPSNNRKYVCQACRNKMRMAELEELFRERFYERQSIRAENPGVMGGNFCDSEALLNIVSQDIASISTESARLTDLIKGGYISVSTYTSRKTPLDERLAELSRELKRLDDEVTDGRANRIAAGNADKAVKDNSGWSDFTAEEKRRIVENCFSRIDVGSNYLVFHLSRNSKMGEAPKTLRVSKAIEV